MILGWLRRRRDRRTGRECEWLLAAFASRPSDWWWKADLAEAAGMAPGSLYPALLRLEGQGRVVSRWVDGPSPRARVYKLVVDR